MEYYKLLQLNREPFSNSPDPEYFFNSRQHMGCLQKLELALRLKRGLNVIIGDVGTGKTTLCRQLIRNFSTETNIVTHLVLDPSYDSSKEFLRSVMEMICPPDAGSDLSPTEMKEIIKRTLFQTGVDADKTTILIIDEGQKISDACLEILRELLNYETNSFKLLQIVIFAQLEFNDILEKHANFADRINLCHHLEPLSFSDTRQLIEHRLKLSSETSKPNALFTLPALWAIYRASHGYPRKIIHLCHQSMLALIIQNQTKAGWALIQSCKNRIGAKAPSRRNLILVTTITSLLLLFGIVIAPALRSKPEISTHGEAFKINPESEEATTAINAVPPNVAPPQKMEAPSPETSTERSATMVSKNKPPASSISDISMADTEQMPNNIDVASPQHHAEAPFSPPEGLGKLYVRPGDTISDMALQVYGTRQNRFLRSVIDANPHIKDPNDINIGQIIEFPSLPVRWASLNDNEYIVVLADHESLEAAVQNFRKLTANIKPHPKLVIMWTPSQGLRFQLVLPTGFEDTESALLQINKITDFTTTDPVIISGWPAETVFYSNPFQNNQKLSVKKRG